MAKSQKGDKRAYKELLEQVIILLRGYLATRISYEEMREEVIQEILISVHHARHTYDAERAFKPWLFSIAKYRLYDYLRKHYRKGSVERDCETIDEESDALCLVEQLEISDDIKKLMVHLPKKQREIVTLVKVDGYTSKEVAEHYNMTESAVKVTVHRALKQLRHVYEESHGK